LLIDLNKLNNNFVSDYSGKYVISFRRYFRITSRYEFMDRTIYLSTQNIYDTISLTYTKVMRL